MADLPVKPCSVVLRVGEVEDYFKTKIKSEPLFEIQKVPTCEASYEASPLQLVNHEFTPEAKRPCLEPCDFNSLHHDLTIKQEPQDYETSDNLVMPEFVVIKTESVDEPYSSSEQESLPEMKSFEQNISCNSVAPLLYDFSILECCEILPPPSSSAVAITSQINTNFQIINRRKQTLKAKSSVPFRHASTALVPGKVSKLNFTLKLKLYSNSEDFHHFSMKFQNAKNYSSEEALSILKNQSYCKSITFANKENRIYFNCEYCSSNYITPLDYFQHFITVHQLTFSCLCCKQIFKNLPNHILKVHHFNFCENVLEVYSCLMINQCLRSYSFECVYCSSGFQSYDEFANHLKHLHHVCRICSENFNTNMELLAHIDVHSSGLVRYFKCISCNFKVFSFQLMKVHLQICSGTTLTQEIIMLPLSVLVLHFVCPYCPLSFANLNTCHEHLLEHQRRICNSCRKIFVTSDFTVNRIVTVSFCVSCNLKLDTSNKTRISKSILPKEFNDKIEILNKSETYDLFFKILRTDQKSKNIIQRRMAAWEDIQFKFRTLDLENMKEIIICNKISVSKYPCLFCGYKETWHFWDHIGNHITIKLSCKTCMFTTACVEIFLFHLNENHQFHIESFELFKYLLGSEIYLKIYEKLNYALDCLFCSFKCENVFNLLNHVTITHLNCKYCGITSLDLTEYFQHNTKQKLENFNNFQCLSCNTMTNCNLLAAYHATKNHSSAEQVKTISYEKCAKIADSPLNLFFCPYCPEICVDQINLLLHLKTHSNARKCSKCARQFLLQMLDDINEITNGKCLICVMISKGMSWKNKVGWIVADDFVQFDPVTVAYIVKK